MDDPLGDQTLEQFLADLRALAQQALMGPECVWSRDASAAFDRIYSTFRRRLSAYVVKKIVGKLSVSVDPDEFVPDLFMRFVRSADKFKPANTHSYSDVVRQFLFTLHQHARYMVRDILDDAKKRVELLHSAVNELLDVRAAIDADPSPAHIKRL